MSKFKVGDKVRVIGPVRSALLKVGEIGVIQGVYTYSSLTNYTGKTYFVCDWELGEDALELVVPHTTKTSTGGPSSYYDMPFSDWTTVNDMMEYLAEHKWGKYGIHLKDIFKGVCRWGEKSGTTQEYDAKKIIYYGARVLMMIVGKDKLREYLKELLDDKQFK